MLGALGLTQVTTAGAASARVLGLPHEGEFALRRLVQLVGVDLGAGLLAYPDRDPAELAAVAATLNVPVAGGFCSRSVTFMAAGPPARCPTRGSISREQGSSRASVRTAGRRGRPAPPRPGRGPASPPGGRRSRPAISSNRLPNACIGALAVRFHHSCCSDAGMSGEKKKNPAHGPGRGGRRLGRQIRPSPASSSMTDRRGKYANVLTSTMPDQVRPPQRRHQRHGPAERLGQHGSAAGRFERLHRQLDEVRVGVDVVLRVGDAANVVGIVELRLAMQQPPRAIQPREVDHDRPFPGRRTELGGGSIRSHELPRVMKPVWSPNSPRETRRAGERSSTMEQHRRLGSDFKTAGDQRLPESPGERRGASPP